MHQVITHLLGSKAAQEYNDLHLVTKNLIRINGLENLDQRAVHFVKVQSTTKPPKLLHCHPCRPQVVNPLSKHDRVIRPTKTPATELEQHRDNDREDSECPATARCECGGIAEDQSDTDAQEWKDRDYIPSLLVRKQTQ